jgi:hypothetical protein
MTPRAGLAVALALALGPWAGPAGAATVAVQSGEHETFSRLVLTLPSPGDWQLTRTADGYLFDPGLDDLLFDLDRVFDYIPRDRLGAAWADPGSSVLALRVTCACHALPFELRPGLVVIDIRDGPPPPGAAFELDAAGQPQPPLSAAPPRRPRLRPAGLQAAAGVVSPVPAQGAALDWMALAGFPARAAAAPALAAGAPAAAPGDARLDAMRSALLGELARGAAQGTVDLALPSGEAAGPHNLPPNLSLAMPDQPGALPVDPAALGRDLGKLTADGRACLPDAVLDLPAWGDPRPAAAAIGPMTAGLTGEFDRPQPETVARAVRYLLHLGFGAEARQLAATFAPDDAERPLWDALARVLDGETPAEAPFAGMQGCDSAAALWALLADTDHADVAVDEGAVRRTFAALPAHLRRNLGPALAERLVARGAMSSADAVASAMARAAPAGGPEMALVDTRLGLAGAGPMSATAELPDPGALAPHRPAAGLAGLEAALASVDTHLLRDESVPDALASDLAARSVEFRGSAQEPAIRARLILARASRGDFATAFAMAGPGAEDDAALWDLLARKGDDSALLVHAVRDPAMALPRVAGETRMQIAQRLRALGLAGPAQLWETGGPSATGHAAAPSAANASDHGAPAARLGEGGGGAAVAAALPAPEDRPPAADPEGDRTLRAAVAARDWAAVAAAGDPRWSTAAARADGAAPDLPDAGPLARARALVDEAAATRGDIDALLAATAIAGSP